MFLQVLYQFFLAIVLMGIYLKGYFPITQHETVIIEPPEDLDGVYLDPAKYYRPQIDRLVLIIIDALRYDFITETNMPFLHNKMHCMLKVKVEAPTVTLPRIKALTTGAVPQFIDIVLNLGAKSKVDDSFIHRAKASGKHMVFYGDNTWLYMFPNEFAREEGTTSFYVNDFTEVDDNVTRHIDAELVNTDWDMMFLHYLGLDHIGHVRGPFSNLIKPKLHEMDEVVARIINASDAWNNRTLIMVTGDHGMKDSGGHGGTTYAETHVPLIIHHNKGIDCSRDDETETISQTDLANTISALLGIAMPANSIGKVLPSLMHAANKAQLLYTLYYNTKILQRTTNKCKDILLNANAFFKMAVLNHFETDNDANNAIALYQTCLQEMSDDLVATSVKQDVTLIVFALIGTMNCFLVIINLHVHKQNANWLIYLQTMQVTLFLVLNFACNDETLNLPWLLWLLIATMACTLILNTRNAFKSPNRLKYIMNSLPLILHAALLISSSYIEFEEQIFYYFMCTVSVAIASVNYQQTKRVTMATAMPLTVIEIMRIARSLNRDWFLKDENLIYLQMFHVFSLVCTYFCFKLLAMKPGKYLVQQPVLFAVIFLYKFYYEKETAFAQAIWAMILVQLIPIFPNNCPTFHERMLNVWVLILTFLLRPYNCILIPAMLICSMIFKKSVQNLNHLIVIHVWLGYTFFFLQGHSNSIASIDLAPGYTGLSSYVPIIVGLLTLFHTYGFQTLSLLLLFYKPIVPNFNVIIGYKLLILIVIYVVIFIQRGHLFVWSVFAPKLLIECVHTLVLFIQILLYYAYQLLIFLCFYVNNKK